MKSYKKLKQAEKPSKGPKVKRLSNSLLAQRETELEKGLLQNAALATAMAVSTPAIGPANAQDEASMAAPKVETKHAVSLHPELHGIASIESSGGMNKKHPTVTYGLNRGHTAGGSTGLMPITVKETVARNPELKQRYGHLLNAQPHEITHAINNSPDMEHEIANAHWDRLTQHFGHNTAKKAFAWNQGITAAKRATDDHINAHPYVKKYQDSKTTTIAGN